jgi:hypothetical protein
VIRSNSDPEDVARELQSSKTIRDPAREKLLATRKAVVDGWVKVAATLDAQGEIVMAGDVRYYAAHLPPVLTQEKTLVRTR